MDERHQFVIFTLTVTEKVPCGCCNRAFYQSSFADRSHGSCQFAKAQSGVLLPTKGYIILSKYGRTISLKSSVGKNCKDLSVYFCVQKTKAISK